MKKIITVMAFALVLLMSFSSIQLIKANGATVSIDPPMLQIDKAYVGQTINIDITIDNVQNLWSWFVGDLSFNSSMLNLTSVQEGPFLKQGGQTLFIWTSQSPQIKNGTIPEISDTLMENSTASGSGVLATLHFKVISAGQSQITLNETKLSDPNEITPDVSIVTGKYEQINNTSTDGNIIINNTSIEAPNDNNTVLFLGLAVALIASAVTATVYLKRPKKRVKRKSSFLL